MPEGSGLKLPAASSGESSTVRNSVNFLIRLLTPPQAAGNALAVQFKLVRKPVKIYIENTNLLRAIAGELSKEDPVGTVRETFIQHHLISAGLQVRIPARGDFLVEDKYLLEVGGRRKGKKQIAGKENAYIVKDDIDMGFGNIIPMWLFGFLY